MCQPREIKEKIRWWFICGRGVTETILTAVGRNLIRGYLGSNEGELATGGRCRRVGDSPRRLADNGKDIFQMIRFT